MKRRLAALQPTTILAIGFALFIIYAFPGYMSSDSALQLAEGRAWRFSNHHPPIMAVEWGLFDRIISGPAPMLVVQGTMFLVGLYHLLRRAMSPRAAAWLAIVLLLYPPILTTMAVIWKDSQMAAYLVAACAALTSPRRRVRLAGIALATIAAAMRYNGFAAVVPIVVVLFEWRPGARWFVRYGLALAVAVACAWGALRVDRWLVTDDDWIFPGMGDIDGVLAFEPVDRSDAELRELLRGTPLRVTDHIHAHAREIYNSRNTRVASSGDQRLFDPPADEAQRDAVMRAWREMITSDWRAYLAYRADVFGEVIGWSRTPWSMAYHQFLEWPEDRDPTEHDAAASPIQRAVGDWLERHAHRRWFRPHFYLILAVALLVVCCRDRTSLALLASGIGYELSYFPSAGTPDFRYSHWLVVTTCIATVLLFVRRLAR